MAEEIKVLKGISKGGETYDIDAKYWNGKSSIKTINGQSLLGSGNIDIKGINIWDISYFVEFSRSNKGQNPGDYGPSNSMTYTVNVTNLDIALALASLIEYLTSYTMFKGKPLYICYHQELLHTYLMIMIIFIYMYIL